jgi:glycine betaine/proline transport system substrate-binding protein
MMNFKEMKTFLLVCVVLSGCLLAAGCTGPEAASSGAETTPAAETVVVGIGPWGTAYASGYVVKGVLEEAGYDVELKFVDIGVAFQGVADGDLDCYLDAWVPTCHENYMAKYGDQFETLGNNMEGTRIGMQVPSYVPVDSIEDLPDYVDEFEGKIISIEPGSGTVRMSEECLEVYDLEGYEVVAGSEVGMLAELKGAIEDEEWIVITCWTPHWAFTRWDIKYLDDPDLVYGPEEYIATLARFGLEEDNPGAYGILNRFHWDSEDMAWVMYKVDQEGLSDEEAAAAWIENNRDKVDVWLGNA